VARIENVTACELLDSRGVPTLEVEIVCAGGAKGRALVPSGASTGMFEAHELRDQDPSRYSGKGVLQAVRHVQTEIASALRGRDASEQTSLDHLLCELDGTPEKRRLGANAILGCSLALASAAAAAAGRMLVEHLFDLWKQTPPSAFAMAPNFVAKSESSADAGRGVRRLATPQLRLPMPMVNMISGGLHAGGNLDLQDFLILPVGASRYSEALEWVVRVYRQLGKLLRENGYEGFLVGDEGGFGPRLESHAQALEFLVRAIEASKLRPGADVAIGLDVASSRFYDTARQAYVLREETSRVCDSERMIDLLDDWARRFPILSIEDGQAEQDWAGWKLLTQRLGGRAQLIGDDLFVTNTRRIEQGIQEHAANAVLIKVNQIGTLSETFAAMRLALDHNYWPVVSARSGETEDPMLADLAVATGAGQIKVGSIVRSERLAKYNQLLRLESQLGDRAEYLGGQIFDSLM